LSVNLIHLTIQLIVIITCIAVGQAIIVTVAVAFAFVAFTFVFAGFVFCTINLFNPVSILKEYAVSGFNP
jgi:hypothetical protein